MGNFGLNGSVSWLTNTDGKLCLFAKKGMKVSAIFFWTALVLEIIMNLFGQTSAEK